MRGSVKGVSERTKEHDSRDCPLALVDPLLDRGNYSYLQPRSRSSEWPEQLPLWRNVFLRPFAHTFTLSFTLEPFKPLEPFTLTTTPVTV